MKFADPKNDLAFKKIFGDEKHKNILISFLNSVLDFKENFEIIDVFLEKNNYRLPQAMQLKEIALDINAINKINNRFEIKVQLKNLDFNYDIVKSTKQLQKGNDYTQLKKVYFIGILNFNIFDNQSYISRHLIINQETNTQDLNDFEFSFLELPKFTKELEQLETVLDKWIYFIKNASELTIIPEQYSSITEFKEAFTIATQTTWDKKELEVYDYMSLREFDEINALRTAERKGMEKGMQAKALEIAKNLLSENVDINTIAIATNLSIDAIQKIKLEIPL